MNSGDSPITTDAELEATLDRIRHFQSQLVRLRQVETDPEAYRRTDNHGPRPWAACCKALATHVVSRQEARKKQPAGAMDGGA